MEQRAGGRPKRWIMIWTIILWTLATSAYAYVYVTSRVGVPDAVGYEKDWSWQLFSFSLARLAVLILVLGALLYVAHRLWSFGGPFHGAANMSREPAGTRAAADVASSSVGRSASVVSFIAMFGSTFRFARGRCSCRNEQSDAVRRAVCERLLSRLTEMRTRGGELLLNLPSTSKSAARGWLRRCV
jgi:hypothetical protein